MDPVQKLFSQGRRLPLYIYRFMVYDVFMMNNNMTERVVAAGAEIELGRDEYFVAVWNTPGKGYGYNYSCHRTLNAARRKARKMNGRVDVCANGHAMYRVVEG